MDFGDWLGAREEHSQSGSIRSSGVSPAWLSFRILLLAVFLSFSQLTTPGAELAVKTTRIEPPGEVGESIRKLLQSTAVQLLDSDKPVWEFWFRNDLPVKSKPESPGTALGLISETTLLAVVSVHADQRDYKDNEIPAGVYTARFGLQPQDGDHLGTAEYAYFAVLIPAKADQQLEGISTFKAMAKASGKDTSTGHPIVLSLRPATSEQGDFPALNAPATNHKSVRVKIPAQISGSDSTTNLIIELVYKGKGKV